MTDDFTTRAEAAWTAWSISPEEYWRDDIEAFTAGAQFGYDYAKNEPLTNEQIEAAAKAIDCLPDHVDYDHYLDSCEKCQVYAAKAAFKAIGIPLPEEK